METQLTPIIKTITLKGFKAVIRLDKETKNQIFVTWKNPKGFEVTEWNDHSEILEPLLDRVKFWIFYQKNENLTLWSY